MLTFTVTFRGPFHVATGQAGDGLDTRIDQAVPLPASSLKGLMRAEAEHVLGVLTPRVAEIFGVRAAPVGAAPVYHRPGRWAWSDLEFDGPTVSRWARVRVDEKGRSDETFLQFGEHIWITSGTFTVEELSVSGAVRDADALILRAAARSISSLGSSRRRGEGWVSVADDEEWTAAHTSQLRSLLRGDTA